MSKPTSRQSLIDYCLRTLGSPVVEINVATTQLDDRADEAIQLYQEYHSDATFEHMRKHQITADDITNDYILIPENLIFVSHILPCGSGSGNMFSVEYQMHLNDVYDLRSPSSMINYAMAKERMGLMDMLFDNGYQQNIRFNRHLNRLHIDGSVGSNFKVGDWMVVVGYSTLDPEDYIDVYNDMFLKRYLTALIKKQWGTNMKKFNGMMLPGGVEINGQTIYDEAVTELEQIEETMQSRYEYPPMMAVG
jgi:hypothetical protein